MNTPVHKHINVFWCQEQFAIKLDSNIDVKKVSLCFWVVFKSKLKSHLFSSV